MMAGPASLGTGAVQLHEALRSEGLMLGLVLCWCHLEILHTFEHWPHIGISWMVRDAMEKNKVRRGVGRSVMGMGEVVSRASV